MTESQTNTNASKEDFFNLLENSILAQNKIEKTVVTGTVTKVFDESVEVDVGVKSPGIVSIKEFEDDPPPQVGDQVEVYLFKLEDANHDYRCILSKTRAQKESIWQKLMEHQKANSWIEAVVAEVVPHGVIVIYDGIKAFCPRALTGLSSTANLQELVGKTQMCRIVKTDKSRFSTVVSFCEENKQYDAHRKKQIISELKIGDILTGTVKANAPYGTFVTLIIDGESAFDALIPRSEITWGNTLNPKDFLKEGDTRQFMVINIDTEKQQINLSAKRLDPDPWTQNIQENYKEGTVVENALVKDSTDYGYFVEVIQTQDCSFNGLLHSSKIGHNDSVQVGQRIAVQIIDICPEKRHIALALVKNKKAWETEIKDYKIGNMYQATVIKIGQKTVISRLDNGLIVICQCNPNTLQQLQVNSKIQLKLTAIDNANEKIFGTINPGDETGTDVNVLNNFVKNHDKVVGTIIKTQKEGITVTLSHYEDGVVGFIPISQLSLWKSARDANNYAKDDKIEASVIGVNNKNKTISLSVKKLEEIQQKQAILQHGSATAGSTLGEVLGRALESKTNKDNK